MMNKESMELEDMQQVSYSEVSVTQEQPTDGTLDLSWKYRTGEKLMMNEEIWKSYKTFNHGAICSDIEVSNFGNVRGAKVRIKNKHNVIVNRGVYRLVWELFVGPVPKGYVIHHKDHNPLNDRLDNLTLMTNEEHSRHHQEGRHHSEETRQKMSKSRKGNQNAKDHHPSEDAKRKMSEAKKGIKWFNDGVKCVRAFECPEGFVPGRIKKRKQ